MVFAGAIALLLVGFYTVYLLVAASCDPYEEDEEEE